MRILSDYRFLMNMMCGGDVWGLSGRVFGHPRFEPGERIWISAPVSFDEEKMIVKTTSGSIYKLESCAGNTDEVHQEIRDVIERGGYSVH